MTAKLYSTLWAHLVYYTMVLLGEFRCSLFVHFPGNSTMDDLMESP